MCLHWPSGLHWGNFKKNGIMWNGTKKNSKSALLEGKHFKQIFLNNLLRNLPQDKQHWNTSAGLWSKLECVAEASARNMQIALYVPLWILKPYIIYKMYAGTTIPTYKYKCTPIPPFLNIRDCQELWGN